MKEIIEQLKKELNEEQGITLGEDIIPYIQKALSSQVEKIEAEIDDKFQEYKILKKGRCKFSRDNETVGESNSRTSGFLSGLLTVKEIISKYKT